jgi:hypothetical protein
MDTGRPPTVHHSRRFGDVVNPEVGDFAQADVLVEEESRCRTDLHAGGAGDRRQRRIVMPGSSTRIITSSRRRCAASSPTGCLPGTSGGDINYFQYILQTFAPVYRPLDVYINELFSGLSQFDDGVTTVHDISQPPLAGAPDAAIQGRMDARRRAAFGYFERGAAGNSIRTTRCARSSGSRRATSSP